MKVPAVVQDTVEALVVVGARVKRLKRKLITQQGEIEKMINEFEIIDKFIQRREEEIKKLIAEEYQ